MTIDQPLHYSLMPTSHTLNHVKVVWPYSYLRKCTFIKCNHETMIKGTIISTDFSSHLLLSEQHFTMKAVSVQRLHDVFSAECLNNEIFGSICTNWSKWAMTNHQMSSRQHCKRSLSNFINFNSRLWLQFNSVHFQA